ncbi:MAG: flagellar biosynthetic protein FliR [Hyphomicrobium sp.]|nr:flagellar biosynthetic protein FliR [Hyphomicrobium sp.]
MTEDLKLHVYVAAVVLARVSSFLAVVPVLSALRVPPLVRAHLALVLSLTLAVSLYPSIVSVVTKAAGGDLIALVSAEVVKGLLLGFLVRLFFLALAFAGDFVGQLAGYTVMMTPGAMEGEPATPLANLLVMFAAVVFFLQDLHLLLIEKLTASYIALPPGAGLDRFQSFDQLASALVTAFLTALQISAPFVIYAMVCNIVLGLANRLVPQVPIQLVSAPLMMLGGLFVAMFTLGLAAQVFLGSLADWMSAN